MAKKSVAHHDLQDLDPEEIVVHIGWSCSSIAAMVLMMRWAAEIKSAKSRKAAAEALGAFIKAALP
eukprot:2005617-Lingulodinium_polyedra.AAC.1